MQNPLSGAAKVLSPKTPHGKSVICTAAMVLVSAATTNVLFGMQGGDMTLIRSLWTGAGFITGGYLVHVGQCATPPKRRRK